MKNHYIFYDVEAVQLSNEEIHTFVGVLYDETYTHIPVQNFCDRVRNFRKSLDSNNLYSDRIILICYNGDYDDRMIEFAEKHKTTISNEELLCYSNSLIEKSSFKENMYTYSKLHEQFRGIRGLFFFDVFKTLKKGSIVNSGGSLEYHAGREGFQWSETLESDPYTYNREDLEATSLVFFKQGGEGVLGTSLYIIEHFLKSQLKVTSLTFLTSIYMKELGIVPTTTCPKSNSAFEIFKSNFKLPFNGKYHNGYFWFEQQDGTFTSVLHKFTFKLNLGGLHKGLLGTCWRSNSERKLYNLDFASFYPSILAADRCPILSTSARRMVKKLLEQRLIAKNAGQKVFSDSLKAILVTIYGMLKIKNTYAPLIVCFIAQVAITWLCSIFEEDTTTLIDINTDGILISTLLEPALLYLKVAEFNSLCSKILIDCEVEIQELEGLYYKDFNNYLHISNGKVSKTKGSFLSSTKIQKLPSGHFLSQLLGFPVGFNVINYDKIIGTWLESGIIIPAIVLQKLQGKKTLLKDFVPFEVDAIDNPSISSTTCLAEGESSMLQISEACIRGFNSHFLKSDDTKTNLKVIKIFTHEQSTHDFEECEDACWSRRLIVPYNRITELTTAFCKNNLMSLSDALKKPKGTLLLFALHIVIPRSNKTPVIVLDLDFKDSSQPEEFKWRVWKELNEKKDFILYAETISPAEGSVYERKGIHVFILRENYKKYFSNFYPELQDRTYLGNTARKSILLYANASNHENLLTIGSFEAIEDVFANIQFNAKNIQRRERILKIPDHESDELKAAFLKYYVEIESFPSEYNEWLSTCTYIIDSAIFYGISSVFIEKDLYQKCLNCQNSGPKTEKEKSQTKAILNGLISSYEERKSSNRLFILTVDNLIKKEISSQSSVKKLLELYNPVNTEEIELKDFFNLSSPINILKAVTGVGKTTLAVSRMLDCIIKDLPFIYITNTKLNVSEVSKKLMDAVLAKKDSKLRQTFFENFETLNSETSSTFRASKFILTTHHYFLIPPDASDVYKVTKKILKSKFNYVFFFDECDDFFQASEFCFQNGSRYTEHFSPESERKLISIQYCPRCYDDSGRNLCKNCSFIPSSRFIKQNSGSTKYQPLFELYPNDQTC